MRCIEVESNMPISTLEAITKSLLFEGIEDLPQRINMLNYGEIVIPKGKTLTNSRNRGPTCIWIVVSGEIEIRLKGVRITTRKQSSVLGELEFFWPDKRTTFEMFATEETRCVKFRLADLFDIGDRERLIWNLGRIAAKKLYDADKLIKKQDSTIEVLDKELNRSLNEWYRERSSSPTGARAVTPRKDKFVFWFSDLIGYTAAVRDAEPSEIQSLVSQALNVQQEAIVENDGHVDKFMGDGVMAFWPLSDSNVDRIRQSHLSLLAALESVVKLAELGGDTPGKFRLRIGLHSGEALFGNFGTSERWQITLIGPDVNFAARLEQHKGSDSRNTEVLAAIRVSPVFYECLCRNIRKYFTRVRPIEDKNGNQFECRSCAVKDVDKASTMIQVIKDEVRELQSI